MTRRLATAIVAVLVLFATAMPAATACCVGKPGGKMAAMHASMPCCAGRCAMSSPNNDNRDRDVMLTPAPPPQAAAGTAAAVVIAATPARAAIAAPAMERGPDELSSPPPFLVNSQFRI